MHIVASITVFVNALPLYLPRRGVAIAKRKDCVLMPCSFAARMAAEQAAFFWHLHVLPPIRGFALFN